MLDRWLSGFNGHEFFLHNLQNQIKFLFYWSWYRLGVASWRNPSPQLAPLYTVKGCVGSESIANFVNLTHSGFESNLPRQKARTSTTQTSGQSKSYFFYYVLLPIVNGFWIQVDIFLFEMTFELNKRGSCRGRNFNIK